ncbi:hypothetical protein CEXT_467091 [Caerostris extrusa]|uniref:Uncharacterized protein n=1 Tax=Caerostris extrusa TaxID=172846 RepID=A0AAV4WCK3_CAEEX|nr:hypothetical protein CEXT_467091 [Caerostris extrusa]
MKLERNESNHLSPSGMMDSKTAMKRSRNPYFIDDDPTANINNDEGLCDVVHHVKFAGSIVAFTLITPPTRRALLTGNPSSIEYWTPMHTRQGLSLSIWLHSGIGVEEELDGTTMGSTAANLGSNMVLHSAPITGGA